MLVPWSGVWRTEHPSTWPAHGLNGIDTATHNSKMMARSLFVGRTLEIWLKPDRVQVHRVFTVVGYQVVGRWDWDGTAGDVGNVSNDALGTTDLHLYWPAEGQHTPSHATMGIRVWTTVSVFGLLPPSALGFLQNALLVRLRSEICCGFYSVE